jgi:hypothetical protein
MSKKTTVNADATTLNRSIFFPPVRLGTRAMTTRQIDRRRGQPFWNAPYWNFH